MTTEATTAGPAGISVSAGRSAVVDAADVALVIEARQLRRRWKLVRRVLRSLFIVLFIVGCFAAFAIPSMSSFPPCRSRQSEAKGNLKALYVSQESYRAEFDVYEPSDFSRIGFAPRGSKLRYTYALTDVVNPVGDPATAGFVGWAFSTDPEHAGDVWRISEKNDLEVVVNRCTR
ncbi:MAG: hypothetical protein Q8O67_07970 [Deltaproteobacteria bacterium]|nr:hypothetical protein [Deltaproteobacteria bacterium]